MPGIGILPVQPGQPGSQKQKQSQKKYTQTQEIEFKSESKPHTAADAAVRKRPADSASSPTTNPYKP